MDKRKVLITGASRGIGLAIAKKLAADYTLILHASSESSFTEAPAGSQLLCADLSDPESVRVFCERLKKEHGDLYGVINNAGVTLSNGIIFQKETDIDRSIQINLKSPIMISKAAFKIFNRNKKGVLINMSSIVGENGNPFQSVYAAAKAGIVAFSKSLAQEAGALNIEHDIRVVCISPGFITTEMTDTITEEQKQISLNRISAKKAGNPEQVADLAAFLLSDRATYVNGSTIQINGGMF